MDIDLNICNDVGVSSAIVYALIEKECDESGVFFEGHPYSRMSISDLSERLPFYSKKTIQRAVYLLESYGLIESKLFIGTTKWRRIKRGPDS